MAYKRETCASCGRQVAEDKWQTLHFSDGRFMHRRCYWTYVLTSYPELEWWSDACGVSIDHLKHRLQKVIWEYRQEDRRQTSQAV